MHTGNDVGMNLELDSINQRHESWESSGNNKNNKKSLVILSSSIRLSSLQSRPVVPCRALSYSLIMRYNIKADDQESRLHNALVEQWEDFFPYQGIMVLLARSGGSHAVSLLPPLPDGIYE